MQTEMEIEFLSYDGKYPTLCTGNLILKLDNKTYQYKVRLISKGSVTVDYDCWDFTRETGE